MLTRRNLLSSLALGGAGLGAVSSVSRAALQTSAGLAEFAARSGRFYGSSTSTYQLRESGFSSALAREANMLVPEYELKRAAIEPQPGTFAFEGSDALAQFARRHSMTLRGHTLVWHKANPAWLQDALASPKETILTEYIQRVVGRYRGQMHSWDVVNEAISPGSPDDLRQTLWLKAFGPSYLDVAFHAAREADPAAMLVYNDQGCEAGGAEHDRFRAATLKFLERAIARRVPIDAYGMQAHLQAFGPPVDQRKLRYFLDQVRALGLRILVTEHDVDDSGGSLDVAVRDRAVAGASRRFLDVALDSPATLGVLTWGLSDRFLDPPGWRDALKGYSPRMLPLDAAFARKPLWGAIAASFSSARDR